MKNINKYGLEIKGELTKRDTKMIAKIYAYSALLAAIGLVIAALGGIIMAISNLIPVLPK